MSKIPILHLPVVPGVANPWLAAVLVTVIAEAYTGCIQVLQHRGFEVELRFTRYFFGRHMVLFGSCKLSKSVSSGCRVWADWGYFEVHG